MITWGAYSQWGIVESWSLCPERYQWNRRPGPYAGNDQAYKRSYENLITTFNPVKFDPHKWAVVVKDAGVKYMPVMAKHHDGFCMYDSDRPTTRSRRRVAYFTRIRGLTSPRRCAASFARRDSASASISRSRTGTAQTTGAAMALAEPEPQLRRQATRTVAEIQGVHLEADRGIDDRLWPIGHSLAGWRMGPPARQDLDMSGMAAMARKHQPGLIVVDRTVPQEREENYLTPEQRFRQVSAVSLGNVHDHGHQLEL